MKSKKPIKELRLFLPEEILSDSELSTSDRFLLGIIIALDNKNGCYATNETLASLMNCSRTTISNSVKKLVRLKYIIHNNDINGRGYKRIVSRSLKKHKARV